MTGMVMTMTSHAGGGDGGDDNRHHQGSKFL